MTYTADFLIKKLGLQAHPEGGYFSETYRSEEHLNTESGERSVSTSIYFLLEAGQFSSFHRIKSDEIWHFYYGSPLNVYIIHPDGNLEVMQIGSDLEKGSVFQGCVKAGCWFASRPINTDGFSLVGCTVAPGFDFEDFELADASLADEFPLHKDLIASLLNS